MGLHYRAGSLIPETIKEMEADPEWKRIQDSLKSKGQKALTREEQKKTQRSLDRCNTQHEVSMPTQPHRVPVAHRSFPHSRSVGLPSFAQKIETAGVGPLVRGAPDILQLNIGLYCNQACTHCHVESSPKRTELMSTEVAARCLELLDSAPSVSVVDITGGAPELCPAFRDLVLGARERGREVIDRCNLTVLLEPGQEDTAQFLADNRVRIVASLPCYSQVPFGPPSLLPACPYRRAPRAARQCDD